MSIPRAVRLSLLCGLLFIAILGSGWTSPKQRVDLNRQLFQAINKRDARRVKSLLALGADPNAKETDQPQDNVPALNNAAFGGNTEIMRLLIDHGARLDVRNGSGETPLICAVTDGHTDAVKLLLQRGADPNQGGYNGRTALMEASSGDEENTFPPFAILELLVRHGSDVNAQDNDGVTALMIASGTGYFKAITYFIAHGARLETRDNNGTTALMVAGKTQGDGTPVYSDERSARILVAHGANVNARDKAGDTPLMYAAQTDPDWEASSVRFARILVRRGARADARNKSGKTTLQLAREHHLTKLAAYLSSVQSKHVRRRR